METLNSFPSTTTKAPRSIGIFEEIISHGKGLGAVTRKDHWMINDYHRIGLRENQLETMFLSMKYGGLTCTCSRKPIQ